MADNEVEATKLSITSVANMFLKMPKVGQRFGEPDYVFKVKIHKMSYVFFMTADWYLFIKLLPNF